MKIFFQVIIIPVIAFIISCESNNDKENNLPNDQIIGYWVSPVYTDSTISFDKATSLKEDEYSFAFLEEKLFIERKNSGWCGTPPVSYTNFEGSWSRNSDTIGIKVGYWGGLTEYIWIIIALDDSNLTIRKIK